jgi:hypothetical protein
MGYTPEGCCTCGIRAAISAAAVDDGTVSARTAERMGYTDPLAYCWQCSEFELREEVKIANKEALEMVTSIIGAVRKNNPYPASVFPDRTDEQLAALHEALLAYGMTADGFFGAWGRQVWDMSCQAILDQLRLELEDRPTPDGVEI